MRFILITLGVAVAHIVTNIALFYVSFTCALSAFGDGGWVPIGDLACAILAILNLPILLWKAKSHPSVNFWTQLPVDSVFPLGPYQLLWSLVFGCLVALVWVVLVRKRAGGSNDK